MQAGPVDQIDAAASWARIAFISDLHLSASAPKTADAFRSLLERPVADALFILGDLFEYWIGDDMLGRPFEYRCAEWLVHATRRYPVFVMRGNRDFLLRERFFCETGCQDLTDPCRLSAWGQTALLTHGDALCIDDKEYQKVRAQVRTCAWQDAILSRPFEERLALAQQLRTDSRGGGTPAESYADVDPSLSADWLLKARAEILIHGHTHRPGSDCIAGTFDRHVLSDWDLDHASIGRAEILIWAKDGITRERFAE